MGQGGDLPLSHLRVVDFTATMAGAYATMWLGVMGAEVIKVESRLQPDTTRRLRRTPSGDVEQSLDPRRAYFDALNQSKLGVTLNLRDPRGLDLARSLIAISDVLVEGFSTGVMERFGLGYEQVKALQPNILYASVSGYGRSGPLASYIAYGPTIAGYSGLDHLTGYRHGAIGTVIGGFDAVPALFAAFGLLAALQRGEQGPLALDLSMADAHLWTSAEALIEYGLRGTVRGPTGNRHPRHLQGVYRCQGSDRWVAVTVETDQQWSALCQVIDAVALASDAAMATPEGRLRQQDRIDAAIEAWTRRRTPEEAAESLQRAGIAAGPVLSPAQAIEDAHLWQRGMFQKQEVAGMGQAVLPRLAIRMDGQPSGRYTRAPGLGEQNGVVFKELLGLDEAAYRKLVQGRVIF